MVAPSSSSFFSRDQNSSVASFLSSSNDTDLYGTSSSRGYNSQTYSSPRTQQRDYFSSPLQSSLRLPDSSDGSSDADFSQYTSQGRRRDSLTKRKGKSGNSKPSKELPKSTSGGVGTLRGLGRKLFSRSSTNLVKGGAPMLDERSQSTSSSSTGGAHSPLLTPTTPPHVQPVWLPNGQKDFFATFSGLPSSMNLAAPIEGLSPKTIQGAFSSDSQAFETNTSSLGHGSSTSSSSHQSAALSLPTLPSTAATPSTSTFSATRREVPAAIKEEEDGDSDFLRAVLNFGDGDEANAPQSFRGGRAAPLPPRSSSLGDIHGITSSPSSFKPPASPIRLADGRVLLTQEAAKSYASEKPAPRYVVVKKGKYRTGLFGADSESEDEYGKDEESDDGDATAVATPETVSAPPEKNASESVQYPSFISKARTPSPSNGATTPAVATRPIGLDSAAKRALYNCTLLKVHTHLAPTLAGDAEARSQIPVIAAGEILYSNEDLRFPRSINPSSSLRSHTTTHSFSRNLHVALARTEVMRKLRRERLRIEQEVEISWFQRRYGSTSIGADQIASALKQRQISPEALAKAHISAPSLEDGIASSRRLSGIVNLEAGQKLQEKNGIVVWARRPGFLERMNVLVPADEFAPGEVLVDGMAKLAVSATTSEVSFSPRIRVLAGLPSVEEERRLKYSTRPRGLESKRRLTSSSEPAVWDGTDHRSRRESSQASPVSKPKRLPPWMAPRDPQLLSPGSAIQRRLTRAASEGPTAFSTLHQNSSSASIPEAPDQDEKYGDSSDEEVPLARLSDFRAQRAAEKERILQLENEVALLRQGEEERKAREEEARRMEAERMYEERKAAVEARRREKNKKLLQEARDRRGFTRASMLLNEPNYGAGNPLLGQHRAAASPSSPNLASDQPSPATVGRSSTNLYAQQEGQRRSRTSVVAPAEQAVSPVASPRMRASATAISPLVDLHRPTLAPPHAHTLPRQLKLAALQTSPLISQRRTSLMPPPAGDALHHATSMHHQAPAPPTSPTLSKSPTMGYMQMEPRHSMSMTNFHAQAYLHAQQQAQMQMHAMQQRPGMMSQTVGVGRGIVRQRPGLQPLVSLYGDVVPSSAMQRRAA